MKKTSAIGFLQLGWVTMLGVAVSSLAQTAPDPAPPGVAAPTENTLSEYFGPTLKKAYELKSN